MNNNNFVYKSVTNSRDIKISGYASIFGIVDHHNDIVVKGAFANSIKNKGDSIKFLWQHDQKEPIGKIDYISEEERGLYIEATITSGTRKGLEAIDLLKKNILDGLSIGFNVVESTFDEKHHRVISNLDLWEVSLVTFPANEGSKIFQQKNIDYKLIQALEYLTDELSQLNREVKVGRNTQNN